MGNWLIANYSDGSMINANIDETNDVDVLQFENVATYLFML